MNSHTVLSALTIGVLDAAAAIGIDTEAVVAEAGFERAWLEDPDSRVPLEVDIRMWQILSRRPIGLELGEQLGVQGMGGVGFAMRHGATVGDALAWLWRFRAVIHPDVVPRMERRSEPAGERVVFARPVYPVFALMREPVVAQAAVIAAMMRALSGAEVRPVHVTLPLARPDDAERYETFFGCPVGWGGDELEVAFDASVLAMPIPDADPRLHTYLVQRAEQLLATLPAEASWTDRARREIAALLPHGEPRLGAVAERLAISERTLHRRLADEGTRFAALVDEARRERALLMLDDRHLSCSEIAFLLGYAEPAPFYRAMKRWTGMTAQAWRRSRLDRTGTGEPA